MIPNLLEIFSEVIRRLEENEIPYMVVGSIASMIYGEPRLTHDMDLVVDIALKDAKRIPPIFPENEFYCPHEEVIIAEVNHRGQFNLIHHDSGLKIDLMIRKQTPHSIVEFARRQKTPFWEGQDAFIATPEDVILKKLDFLRQGGSEKHIQDIRGILSNTEVDESYLQDWITQLGLTREWGRVQ